MCVRVRICYHLKGNLRAPCFVMFKVSLINFGTYRFNTWNVLIAFTCHGHWNSPTVQLNLMPLVDRIFIIVCSDLKKVFYTEDAYCPCWPLQQINVNSVLVNNQEVWLSYAMLWGLQSVKIFCPYHVSLHRIHEQVKLAISLLAVFFLLIINKSSNIKFGSWRIS